MVTQVHEPNKLVLGVNHNHMGGYKLDAWAHSAIKLHIYGKIQYIYDVRLVNDLSFGKLYTYGLLHDKCQKVYSMVDMNLHYLDFNI
jgi:hypothetical protein